jgi:lipopolysaccharide/colanic/teichoic acid biosynthesis glycosyltransferase
MKARTVSHWILVADLAWSLLAFLGAEALRYDGVLNPASRAAGETLLPFLAGTAILWFFLSSWMKLDCFRGGWRFPAVVSHVLLAVLCLMSVLLSAGYLWRGYVSRLALGYFGILLFLGFVGIRYVARVLLLQKYRTGEVRRVVIVGADRLAREVALKIKRHPEMVCEVIGFLSPEDNGSLNQKNSEDVVTVPTIGVIDLLHAQRVTDLILALPRPSFPEVLNLVGRCHEHGISVSFVPQPYELYLSKPSLLDLDGIPILELREVSAPNLFFLWKRTADLVLGAVLSLIALPILLTVAAGLRWTKPRAFRLEKRCGKGGEVFSMLRLNVDRECVSGTWFDRLLVKMSVTELPQLWNVLRSQMSLVGPRPDPPERVKRYSEWEQQRLGIKPGMTGLAQVHGLRDQNSLEEKTRFDLQYILNPSAVTDASILLQTLWTLITRLFHPRVTLQQPDTEEALLFNEVTTHLLEESLQSAHRSQSSAD